jgi:hypothetical protein
MPQGFYVGSPIPAVTPQGPPPTAGGVPMAPVQSPPPPPPYEQRIQAAMQGAQTTAQNALRGAAQRGALTPQQLQQMLDLINSLFAMIPRIQNFFQQLPGAGAVNTNDLVNAWAKIAPALPQIPHSLWIQALLQNPNRTTTATALRDTTA